MLPPFSNPEYYDPPVKMPKAYWCAVCGEYWDYMEKAMACHSGMTACRNEHELVASTSNPNYIECAKCKSRCFKTSSEHLLELLEGC